MAHRRFVYLGIGGVLALVVAMTLTSLDDNLTYYLYPTEAVDQKADFPDGERFRLAGVVVAGSIQETSGDIAFVVTDGGANIDVVLTGAPPPLFQEGAPVLLEGAWRDQIFQAEEALIRHDENYEAPEEGGAYSEG